MWHIYYMEYNYETTSIPHHFLYPIFENYCTNFKPLFIAPFSVYLPYLSGLLQGLYLRMDTTRTLAMVRLETKSSKYVNLSRFSS